MTQHHKKLIQSLSQQRPTDACPAPESFLAKELAALSDADRRRIDAHVEGCAVCQTERRLTTAFDELPGAQNDLDIQRSRRVLAVVDQAPIGKINAGQRRSTRPLAAIAAGIALTCAAFIVMLNRPVGHETPPVTRGATLVLVAPQGLQAAPVTTFEWRAHAAATRYELTVSNPAGDIVWQASSDQATLSTHKGQSGWQRPGTRYTLKIDAYDATDQQVATSGPVRFLVVTDSEESK